MKLIIDLENVKTIIFNALEFEEVIDKEALSESINETWTSEMAEQFESTIAAQLMAELIADKEIKVRFKG